MTMQTTTAATRDLIDALRSRVAVLAHTGDVLNQHRNLIYRAVRGDRDAHNIIRDVILDLIPRCADIDIDLADRLRAQLNAAKIDIYELPRIGSDAINRSYDVESRAQELLDQLERSALCRERRERARVSSQQGRSGYTVAYEAAMRLTVHQRRQLAGAILDS